MCLIIECKKDIPISRELMDEFVGRNNDGFGLMYVKDNKLETEKYFDGTPDQLWERYEATKEYEPVIHLRMKTHGLIDHTNTHPYYCIHGIWLMHNGVLSIGNSSDTNKSDTWHFIDKVINPILRWAKNPHDVIRSSDFKRLINGLIGGTNRIVMGDRGGFIYFNETAWNTITNENTKAKGLRVSNAYAWNESFANPKAKVTHIPYGASGKNHYGDSAKYHSRYFQYTDEGLTQIDTGLWCDQEGEFWERNHAGYFRLVGDQAKSSANKRRRKWEKKLAKLVEPSALLGKKADVKNSAAELLLPEPAHAVVTNDATPVVVVEQNEENDDETAVIEVTTQMPSISKEEYLEALGREWRGYTADTLHAMVYHDPDVASKLLYREFNRV
jgi:hypothetical protein